RNAEEIGVEPIDLIEEACVSGAGLSGSGGIRVVKSVGVPAVGRYLRDTVITALQQFPELLRRISPAGKATAHTDNGYRLVRCPLHCIQLCLHAIQSNERTLQQGTLVRMMGGIAHNLYCYRLITSCRASPAFRQA